MRYVSRFTHATRHDDTRPAGFTPAARQRALTPIELLAVRQRAFTLIELLVVIAIIVALLAILLPSMGRAIEVAHRAVCASNQHQVAVSLLSYASDRRGQLPQAAVSTADGSIHPATFYEGTWRTMRDDYGLVPGAMMCPSSYAYTGGGMAPFLDVYPIGGWVTGASPTEEDLFYLPSNHNAGWTTDHRRVFSLAIVAMLTDMGGCALPYDTVPVSATHMRDPGNRHLIADRNSILDGASTAPYRVNAVSHFRAVGETLMPTGANRTLLDGSVSWVDPDHMGEDESAIGPDYGNPRNWAGQFKYMRSSCSHVKDRYYW